MSAPFQPGDVVVCVDVKRYVSIAKGRIYRVHEVIQGFSHCVEAGLPLLRLEGLLVDNGWGNPVAFLADCFRKIDDEVTDEFRERLRRVPAPKVPA